MRRRLGYGPTIHTDSEQEWASSQDNGGRMDVFIENRYDGLQIEDSQLSSYDAIEHMRRTFMHLQYLSNCQHMEFSVYPNNM